MRSDPRTPAVRRPAALCCGATPATPDAVGLTGPVQDMRRRSRHFLARFAVQIMRGCGCAIIAAKKKKKKKKKKKNMQTVRKGLVFPDGVLDTERSKARCAHATCLRDVCPLGLEVTRSCCCSNTDKIVSPASPPPK